MTKPEVMRFMQKIQSYYETFSIESYKVDEWYEQLKKYDTDDVYQKFEQHLKGDQQEYIPKLHYITKYLKTPEEKEKSKISNYTIKCNLCNKDMNLDGYDRHYDKCLSTKYLIDRIYKVKKQVADYDQIYNLDEKTFEKLYEKYDVDMSDTLKELTNIERWNS